MNLGLVTLGCSKNQVDSEMLLGIFKNNGYTIVSEPDNADIIVVNTCGFIESAKKEAIDTILEMADYKVNGMCKYLIVTGCLAKRYKKDILDTMPEVDLCIGVDEYCKISEILSDFFNKKFLNNSFNFKHRIISTKFPSTYIRISDGCDNRCSYCAIPLIRGDFKSRPMEEILEEVKLLSSQGISEFNIISQDTTRYGLDLYNKLKLSELLHKITQIPGVKWVRVLYMYIYEITDELIEEIKVNDKISKYFDIPIQHINDRLLKLMNRHDTKDQILDVISKIRKNIPNVILRTTLITGFPSETDVEFEELKQYVKKLKFDRLGAFTYSREEDTKSYSMNNQIDEKVKTKRLKEIFELQKVISLDANTKRVGNVEEVLVEDVSSDNKYFVCRSIKEAPDVDGKIYVRITKNSASKLVISDYAFVKITGCNEYDLFARCVKGE